MALHCAGWCKVRQWKPRNTILGVALISHAVGEVIQVSSNPCGKSIDATLFPHSNMQEQWTHYQRKQCTHYLLTRQVSFPRKCTGHPVATNKSYTVLAKIDIGQQAQMFTACMHYTVIIHHDKHVAQCHDYKSYNYDGWAFYQFVVSHCPFYSASRKTACSPKNLQITTKDRHRIRQKFYTHNVTSILITDAKLWHQYQHSA